MPDLSIIQIVLYLYNFRKTCRFFCKFGLKKLQKRGWSAFFSPRRYQAGRWSDRRFLLCQPPGRSEGLICAVSI